MYRELMVSVFWLRQKDLHRLFNRHAFDLVLHNGTLKLISLNQHCLCPFTYHMTNLSILYTAQIFCQFEYSLQSLINRSKHFHHNGTSQIATSTSVPVIAQNISNPYLINVCMYTNSKQFLMYCTMLAAQT